MLDQILKPHSQRNIMEQIRKLDKGIRIASRSGDDIAAQIMRTERDKLRRQVAGSVPLNHLQF